MKRINAMYLTVILAAIVAALGAISVGAFGNGASANGQGFYTDAGGTLRTFSFNAVTKSDGTATGHATLHNRDSEQFYIAEVNCLRVTGNVARVSGIIKNTNNPIAQDKPFFFQALDGGEGNNAEPDGISRLIIYNDPNDEVNDCRSNVSYGFRAIEGGNIQVKP